MTRRGRASDEPPDARERLRRGSKALRRRQRPQGGVTRDTPYKVRDLRGRWGCQGRVQENEFVDKLHTGVVS